MRNYDVKSNQIQNYIIGIGNGNGKYLEQLYIDTKTIVFSFALSILKNISDAEDVMQDTYININRYASCYTSKDKPMAWILTITRNLSYNKLKKNNKHVLLEINEIEKVLINNNCGDGYDKVLLKTILESLNDSERQIVILYSIDGLKHHEIAKLLNLKLSTVLSKYHRALKKIRANYREDINYE